MTNRGNSVKKINHQTIFYSKKNLSVLKNYNLKSALYNLRTLLFHGKVMRYSFFIFLTIQSALKVLKS